MPLHELHAPPLQPSVHVSVIFVRHPVELITHVSSTLPLHVAPHAAHSFAQAATHVDPDRV